MKINNFRRFGVSVFLVLFSTLVVFMELSCSNGKGTEFYHKFPDKSWERFNFLRFEIPIDKVECYNIYLFARLAPDFAFETLDFNMIMNTPAGEERINEYRMKVKSKAGIFCIECSKDSCLGSILLKKEIKISKPGILKIEIENLTPKLITEGVLGVGIRLIPSGK